MHMNTQGRLLFGCGQMGYNDFAQYAEDLKELKNV